MKPIKSNALILGALVLACSVPVYGQDDVLRGFESASAREAVSKFRERLRFLDERMSEQITAAEQLLREDLTKAMKKASESQSFEEVERLSGYLKSQARGAKPNSATKATDSHDAKTNAEKDLAQLLRKIKQLETKIAAGSVLHRQIAGKSYQFNMFGRPQTWQFLPTGMVLVDGKETATQWVVYREDAFICIGTDNGHIDLVNVLDDGAKLEMSLVGDFKNSDTRHVGIRSPN